MERSLIKSIVLIGAGKLATSFGLELYAQGFDIVQVINRNSERGNRLAEKLSASFTDDLKHINRHADLYCLAVSDGAVEEIACNMQLGSLPIVHFSGSVDMQVLRHCSSSFGVFYPLQTFTNEQNREIFRETPICLEANSPEMMHMLKELALRLNPQVYYLDSRQRTMLHLAAVFASNFTNLMYTLSEELLKSAEIPKSILSPLVQKTARNFSQESSFAYQTGPAVRGDLETLNAHIKLLENRPELSTIYQLLSDLIIQKRQDDNI